MTVTVKNIIPSKIAESTQTTQYTANGVSTIIDKFTATNYGLTAEYITVNLVTSTGSAGNNTLASKTKTIPPGDTYSFSIELAGHLLPPGSFISTIASNGTSITIRATGREITS